MSRQSNTPARSHITSNYPRGSDEPYGTSIHLDHLRRGYAEMHWSLSVLFLAIVLEIVAIGMGTSDGRRSVIELALTCLAPITYIVAIGLGVVSGYNVGRGRKWNVGPAEVLGALVGMFGWVPVMILHKIIISETKRYGIYPRPYGKISRDEFNGKIAELRAREENEFIPKSG